MSRNQATGRWRTKLAVYVSSAVAAGLATGFALGSVGSMLPATFRIAIGTLLSLLAIGVAAVGLAGHRLPLLQFDRETPQRWMHLGPVNWALRNGAALGFGASTRLGFASWYVIPATAFLFADPVLGALIYALYAASRAGSAGVLIWANRGRPGFDDRALRLVGSSANVRSFADAHLLAFGLTAFVMVGL